MNRRDFRNLALTRLADAEALLKKRRFSAAYYIAGYAVECGFKACLAKRTRRYEFPPEPKEVRESYYTHDLQKLAVATGLSTALEAGSAKLRTYWTIVKDWNEASRYDPNAGKKAKDILEAIGDPKDGILQCIKLSW